MRQSLLLTSLFFVSLAAMTACSANSDSVSEDTGITTSGTDTGSVTDPDTGGVTDPDTGGVIDPDTGGVIDPDTGGVTDPDTGGVTDPDTGGEVTDTDTGEITDTGSPEPDASLPPSYGSISVLELRIPADNSQDNGAVAAHFANTSWPTGPTPTETFGDCYLAPVDTTGTAFQPSGPSLNAGTITVQAGRQYVLAPTNASGGVTYQPVTEREVFSGGSTISVTGSGGEDVPAFSGSVQAPADPVVSSPNPSAGADWGSRSTPLSVAWDGPNSGTATIIISLIPISVGMFGSTTLLEGNGITCITTNDTGSFSIPSDVLSRFQVGNGINTALSVIRLEEVSIHDGAAEIVLNASALHTIAGSLN